MSNTIATLRNIVSVKPFTRRVPEGIIPGANIAVSRAKIFVPAGRGYDGKWWLSAKATRELGLTSEDFDTTYTEQRPEWLEAEVIRADLDDERVFAVRDEDNDWLVLGGASDGLYVTHLEATGDFSNVEIVKA